MRFRVPRLPALLAALVVLAPPVASAADAVPSLEALRHGYADKLSALAEEAKGAHLGSIALRLFEDAEALYPDQPAARTALGWTREGSKWKPPRDTIPGDGWADDGESDLVRIEKKETALRADFVKSLVAAAAAAKAKKAPADRVDELLWAAIAVDPSDPAPRKALGHSMVAGRYVAPEHAALVAAGLGPTAADLATAAEPIATTEVPARVKSLAGWSDPIPAALKAPTAGEVTSLSNADWARSGAEHLERARHWLTRVLAAEGTNGPAFGFVHPGSMAVARELLTADPAAKPLAAYLGIRPVLTLGSTGLVLATGESSLALLDGLVSTRVESDFLARTTTEDGTKWLAECVGIVASMRLLGTTVGFATTTRRLSTLTGPQRRTGEPLIAFVRRLVAGGADPGLGAVADSADRRLQPYELLVGASVVDWLLRRDATKAAAFLSGFLAATGTPEARTSAAATAAGFASTRALDDAWRHFVADAYPAALSAPTSRTAFRIGALTPMKTVGFVDSVYVPQFHRVSGQLILGGRPYLCEETSPGGSVRLGPYTYGDPPRTVDKDGEFTFPVAREYGGGNIDVKFELSRSGGTWVASRAEAFQGDLDGHPVAVYDLDLDGRFGGLGRDGICLDHLDRPIPLGREMAIGAKVYEIRRLGPDGREIAWRARPVEAKGPDLEAWLAINDVRIASGLPGLVFDPELARGATAHAAYLVANHGVAFSRADAAHEDASKKGATPEGGLAASHGLAADEPTPRAAVRRWLASPREAAFLLDPDARRGAIGASGGVVVFALRDDPSDEPSEFRGPLRFPSADVPGDAGACGVDLVRFDRSFAGAGCPVWVRVAPGRVKLTALRLTLASGAEVPTTRLEGERLGIPGLVALVPAQPLKAATKYALVCSTLSDGGIVAQRAGAFTTASP